MTAEYFKRLEHDRKWNVEKKENKKLVLAENGNIVKQSNLFEARILKQRWAIIDKDRRSKIHRMRKEQEEIQRLQKSIAAPVSCNIGKALQHAGLSELLVPKGKPQRSQGQPPGYM